MPQQNANTEKKKLFGGVLVLMPAALFTKLIGLFYKIPLIAIVGVEGMAYFLSAYHIYSLLFVLSSTGLPTALSLQLSRSLARGEGRASRRILGVALSVFLGIGLLGTALLLFGAPHLAARLAMKDAAAAIVAIAPALALSAFIGAAKGYFQGFHRMGPTALGEVLEAAGKLVFGLLLALFAKGQGMSSPMVAAYAIFGITAGQALSALVLLALLLFDLFRRKTERKGAPPRRAILSELLRVAFPITVSASVMSLVSLVDTALISARLQSAGFAASVANATYSSYGNLAVPLYNLVPSLLSPITLSLMPLLGASLAARKLEESQSVLSSACRLTALFALPASLGLATFARPILTFIFWGQNEAVALAAPLLSLLAISVAPAAFITLTGAALQATGHTAVPIFAMLSGALVKLGLGYFLLPVKGIYILAAPIGTLACNLTVLAIQLVFLGRALPFRFSVGRDLAKPFGAAILSVFAGLAVYLPALRSPIPERFLILPVLATVVATFALFSLLFGAVEQADLENLPMGDKLARLLIKYRLLKQEEKDDKRRKNAADPAKKGI